jgi:hypothetical protein
MSALGLFPRDQGDVMVDAIVAAARERFERAREDNIAKLAAVKAERARTPCGYSATKPEARAYRAPINPNLRRKRDDARARRTPEAWKLSISEEHLFFMMLERAWPSTRILTEAINARHGLGFDRHNVIVNLGRLRMKLGPFDIVIPRRLPPGRGRYDVAVEQITLPQRARDALAALPALKEAAHV